MDNNPIPPTTSAPLTSGEVAARFGVTTTTVKRWAAAGVLPFFRTPGGHYRFAPAAVDTLQGWNQPGAASSTTGAA